jgi:ABC-type Fe3+/spermidine/putrescine transport system ATPase subunit
MSAIALKLTNLSRSFGASTVLRDIELSLARGDRLAVVGPSGSGKTTLLRLIAGLDSPSTGSIEIAERVVSSEGKVIVPPERRNTAMVFQGLALFPHLNALDQIAFAARYADGRDESRRLLERVGLGHRPRASLDQLSGGERQRIALARALAQRPDMILMDEPFANLDDDRRAEMRDLLRTLLSESKATLVLVTHSRDDALDLASHVLVLDRGWPAAAGILADVIASPAHVAAVRSLGLGQIVEGNTADGITAITAFGPVSIAHKVVVGPVRLLVRAAQPKLNAAGVEGEVTSIELRPSESIGRARRFAIVRVGAGTLRVELDNDTVRVGSLLRVTIDGACRPLIG